MFGGRRFQRTGAKAKDQVRINQSIRAPEIRVIGPEGEQLGVLTPDVAIRIAESHGLDLVEVAATAKPPVCKIMDYGKYKYELKKKAASSKKHQHTVQVKEVVFRPNTDEHDFQFKLRHVRRFLDDGNKAKIVVRFRGREMAHTEIGMAQARRVIEETSDVGLVESTPRQEGRLIIAVIAPSKGGAKKDSKKDGSASKDNTGKEVKKKTDAEANPVAQRSTEDTGPTVEVTRTSADS